ncbi:MAG: O-antigen ligase family protein [Candidatus Daviesbacteria bacterium]|nr:O-antigen ligase family protein [Candidatus Daviesbacteria bacterium]
MLDKRSFLLDRIIRISFNLLFLVTPLIWTPVNYELFEYNKMMFVYLLTIVITSAWILKMLARKTLLIKRTPLDIPILLFLSSQILATIFSIDQHTSIFGYYSRSNGGLLSTISYILLYFSFVANFDKSEAIKLLKTGLFGGLLVALYAIPEHFGVSPSCVILRGELSADCWIQDVQARVFATLGQPNWLAAYLGMLIFPSIYFYISEKKIKYLILTLIYYLAFTFTYSRGATLGLIIGMALFLSFWLVQNRFWSRRKVPPPQNDIKLPLLVLGSFLVINLLYGSALTRFQLTNLSPQQVVTNIAKPVTTQLTQLENGGTESGQIRLIVWRGAIDIFLHYPVLGSGVETFAISYYQFRPVAHNLVSEWDFLYNKAHNEFLNYLATTGLAGFASYMSIIAVFCLWSLNKILSQKIETQEKTFILAILATYLAYLVQNFFGFSVVIIAMFFFLFPAIAFLESESVSTLALPKKLVLPKSLFGPLQVLTTLITLILVFNLGLMWKADTFFADGEKNSDNGHSGLSYQDLSEARVLNPHEPLYASELGYTSAQASLALKDTDATLSAALQNQALMDTQAALQTSPKNVSFYRTAARTYYVLSAIDPGYVQKTLDVIDRTITLAPTDPKLYYNKAIILGTVSKNDEAIATLQKAIQLKPNYPDAYFGLSLFYFDQKQTQLAVDTMNKVLELVPSDADALNQLVTWGKQGIATTSSQVK